MSAAARWAGVDQGRPAALLGRIERRNRRARVGGVGRSGGVGRRGEGQQRGRGQAGKTKFQDDAYPLHDADHLRSADRHPGSRRGAPRIDDGRARHFEFPDIAGDDGQTVAQPSRSDDEVGLRERMAHLAPGLDQ